MKILRFLDASDPAYTPWQFAAFRVTFGLYLIWHFLVLLPDAAEIFSRQGSMADPGLNPTYPLAPWNPLFYLDSPGFVNLWVCGCVGLSVLITLGWKRQAAGILLWFAWACLFNRNNLISNPSIPYVGLLLLLLAIIPCGEPLRLGAGGRRGIWRMPIMVTGVTWTLLACGYTFSGLDKLSSPSWINGEAVGLLLDNPLAREGFLRDLMLEAPPAALKLLTWGALGAEIFFLPLCFWRGGRLVAWTALLLLHFGIMLTLSFADLSLGMIMVHLFIFDQRWLGKGKAGTRAVVYYDGECGLCSRAMKFIAEEDTYDQIRLRALQGGAGQEAMAAAGLDPQRLDTMLVEKSGGFLTESRAVTGIAETLGGIWTIGQIANLLPREICDRAYQFVSKRRHAIFGRNRACEMPSEALRRKLAEVGEDGAEAAKER